MNDMDLEHLEAELRRVVPAPPPEEFMARLLAARPTMPIAQTKPIVRARPYAGFDLSAWLMRWMLPATALVIGALVVWRVNLPGAKAAPALSADNVQIDEQLVSTFDTVAPLASGEPVRFRCRTWMDKVVLRDKERGVMIEQDTPRVEVIPVSFETY